MRTYVANISRKPPADLLEINNAVRVKKVICSLWSGHWAMERLCMENTHHRLELKGFRRSRWATANCQRHALSPRRRLSVSDVQDVVRLVSSRQTQRQQAKPPKLWGWSGFLWVSSSPYFTICHKLSLSWYTWGLLSVKSFTWYDKCLSCHMSYLLACIVQCRG